MAFTGLLGTADSRPGNVIPAYSAAAPPVVEANAAPPRKRATAVRLDPPPASGSAKRTAAPLPADQTPILPPARRQTPIDRMPADAGARVSRSLPKPDFVAPDPQIAPRRRAHVHDFVPEPGRTSRGRPLLNETGDSLPVHHGRFVRSVVVPFPGRARRADLPAPGPEPQVLPPLRRYSRPDLAVPPPWRRRPMRLFGLASPSLLPQPPCPYRPHRVLSESDAFVRRPAAACDAPARRGGGDDAPPRRPDECQ